MADPTFERAPLEPTGEEMRRLVDAAMRRIVQHVESLGEQPAAVDDLEAGLALAHRLEEALPWVGSDLDTVLDLLFDRVIGHSFNAAGPGYLAYIPGGGLFLSAVADLVAGSVNRYTGVFAAAPGLVQLELNVVRWLCDLVGFGQGAGGFLSSGGSTATLSAVVTARQEKLGESFLDGVLYVSDQVHHCVTKAARLAGIPAGRIRVVPTEEDGRLSPARVAARLAEDRRAGLRPFLIVGSAGTVNTGAVDPLAGLGELAARERLWFHVDAAYGGFFLLTERGRQRLKGIERAHSVVLDPHKGLFVPYGCGALVVRDRGALRRAHGQDADYLPPLHEDEGRVDFCEITPELSRPYRGLRVWLPLKVYGAAAFRRELDEKLDLALDLAAELERTEGIELVAPPTLSLLALRVVRPGATGERLDELTHELQRRVNHRNRVHLTGTRFGGRYVLRVCVLSFRTHRERVEMALEDLRAGLAELD
ncbi:MAG: pyridoxal-dependent decarboxylase [Thermoanaerobaculia bacterium]